MVLWPLSRYPQPLCRYGLKVEYLTNPDFKQGLEDFISSTGVAAIVLGTRRCVVWMGAWWAHLLTH